MGVTDSLRRRLAGFKNDLDLLPEANEPPSTVLQIIRNNQQEQDWQRLFFHYLSLNESHGLGHALLEHMLSALGDREDFEFSFSRFDLAEVQVEREVKTSNGRFPDAVVWASEDWFICWELKIDAAEAEDQTRDYVDAASFAGIGLSKEDVPDDGHHYLYLAPEDSYSSDPDESPPEAQEFVPVSWQWVADEIRTFLADSHGEYPTRTTTQLRTFIETIQSELTMTQYQENQEEQAELYIDHFNEISEAEQAFENEWKKFTTSWGTKLAQSLDSARIIENSDAPDQYVSVWLPDEENEKREWTFRQGTSDWAYIFSRGWWTKLDDGAPVYSSTEPSGRVGFLHRLESNQLKAIRDHELKFYLRNCPDNGDFYDGFASNFNDDEDIPELLPAGTTRPGRKSNVLEATYDIEVEFYDGFFEAYVAALARAVNDHVVSNPELISRIDKIRSDTVEQEAPF